MKTNGLRNKKPAMARAAWRTNIHGIARRYDQQERTFRPLMSFLLCRERQSVIKWHRAAKGRK